MSRWRGDIAMSWMGVALLGAIGVGIAGRAYAEATVSIVDDPETIFIVLAQLLFHPLITGFLLAALLAAIMSTISSQLLVASSSLTEDFYRLFLRRNASEREAVNVGRGWRCCWLHWRRLRSRAIPTAKCWVWSPMHGPGSARLSGR